MIQAIETHYGGHRFRSRLEARYAIFFDELGIKWRYEVEGYKLPNGEWYLPDFWLPNFNGGMWVEVKPDNFTPEEKQKCWELCNGTHNSVWLANDIPNFTLYEVYYWHDFPPYVMEGDGIPLADKAERENRMFANSGYGETGGLVKQEYMQFMGNRLPPAVLAANEARFEHGEKP